MSSKLRLPYDLLMAAGESEVEPVHLTEEELEERLQRVLGMRVEPLPAEIEALFDGRKYLKEPDEDLR